MVIAVTITAITTIITIATTTATYTASRVITSRTIRRRNTTIILQLRFMPFRLR